MRKWSLTHLSNGVLLRDLQSLAAQDCVHLAKLLAHIGEVQARKLYREAAQPHMHAYCVNVLHFSEDAAWKRIHVAGVARRIPALLDAIAEGRLHLTGACEIAAHLTPENAEKVLADVTHKTREQIKVVVAALAPRPDLEERIAPIAPPAIALVVTAPATVVPVTQPAKVVANTEAPLAPAQVKAGAGSGTEAQSGSQAATVPVVQATPPSRVTPRAPGRYGVQLNIDEATNELLQKAKDLFGQGGKDQLERIFSRALELFVRDLERRKCAKTDKPRQAKRPKSPHTITAAVRSEVWERDQGQCTFVNDEGRRCPSRGRLHHEHVRAKGRARSEGVTTALTPDDVRLLCEEHNQLMAERLYGERFMRHKRESAKAARAAARVARETAGAVQTRPKAVERDSPSSAWAVGDLERNRDATPRAHPA
jgi:5-methylcytosine-specific restriction endonuclease McrA